jgi:hypothetical protein
MFEFYFSLSLKNATVFSENHRNSVKLDRFDFLKIVTVY